MDKNKIKQAKRIRRKGRVRARLSGTADCPRLSIFRSNRGIYGQIINDEASRTIVSVNPKEAGAGNKSLVSLELGKLIAKKAIEKSISRVVFDRNGYKYHGRVKAFADGAREGGLKF